MQVLVNTNNSIEGSDELTDRCVATVTRALDRFGDRISRVELHLADVNGAKKMPDDKHCSMEARLNGLRPVAASANGMTLEQAVSRATEKLTSSLETMIGRLQDRV